MRSAVHGWRWCGRVDSGSEAMGVGLRARCGTGDGRGKSSSSKHAGKCYGDLGSEGDRGRSSNSSSRARSR
jgi:hypothetical protein